MCGTVPDLAIWSNYAERVETLTTGSNDKLADAVFLICYTVRILWCKAFIVMGVTVYDDIGSSFVEQLPEVTHGLIITVD